MRAPTAVEQSDETVHTEDFYAEFAPEQAASSGGAVVAQDWYAEFPDESSAPARERSHFFAPRRSLTDEQR